MEPGADALGVGVFEVGEDVQCLALRAPSGLPAAWWVSPSRILVKWP
jgi:hypothetical protein